MRHILLVLAAATLYLSLSGFQCASSQMNTAELAMNENNYEKAANALQEEVELRPDNGKAWYMLGVARFQLGEYRAMRDAFVKAREHAESESGKLEPYQLLDMDIKTYNGWAKLYDSASRAVYDQNNYTRGLATLESAEYVLPGMPAVIRVTSDAKLRDNNREEANRLYRSYVNLLRSDLERGLEQGLSLGMTRDEVLGALGTPTVAFNEQRQQFADIFSSGLAIYYAQRRSPSDPLRVKGWRFHDSPKATRFVDYWFSADPIFNAALVDYGNKDYDAALDLLQLIEKLDPGYDEVGSLIGQIYIATNRTDEALNLLVERIEKEPENPKLRITYSVLLHDMRDYEKAISVLEDALALDLDKSGKDYQDILFNLGAFNKNWGVRLENAAAAGSDVTAADRAAYEAKYREALKYFSQLREAKGGNEYKLLGEMGNLHALLGQEKGLREVIASFEALQNNETMKNDGDFWRILSDLYSYVGNSEKAAEAKTKAASLGR